jgi:hypothetical protein
MDYRILISHHRRQERMLIQAQVWAPAWVSGPAPDDDGHPVPRDWYTADQWTVTDPPKKLTENGLADICAARGWAPLGDITTEEDGTLVVPVEPTDWRQVLEATAHHRNLMRQAWEAAETAWMGIVAGVPRRKGDDGYVGAIKIARIGDVSRFRVYQIQDEVDHPEEKRQTLAAARRRREEAKAK